MQHELPLLERMAQVAFQLQSLQRAGIHVRLVELEVVLATRLGVVHRGVGVLHQLAEVVAILRTQRDANAGGDEEFATGQRERHFQALQDAFGGVDGSLQGVVTIGTGRQQEGELVTAHARHRIVLVDAGGQARGDILEHAIARGMAQRIVDRLEAIEVEKQQHHPVTMACGLLQAVVQTVLEQGSIRQLGEAIVIGQPMDALLAGLALAHVAEETDVAGQRALLVAHPGDTDPAGIGFAILALEPELAFPTALLPDAVQDETQLVFLLTIGTEHARQLPDHLLGAIAGDVAERLVGLDDAALGIGDHDGRGGMIEDRGGHAQLLVGAPLQGDVPADAEDAVETPLLVPDQHDAQLDRHVPAIGRPAVDVHHLHRQFPTQQIHLGEVPRTPSHGADQVVEHLHLTWLHDQ